MWERDWTGAGSDVGRLSAGKRLIPIETLSPPACLHPKSATVWGQGGGGGGSGGGGGGGGGAVSYTHLTLPTSSEV